MKWTGWLTGSILLGALTGIAAFAKQPEGVTFAQLEEAKASLTAAGFICTPDRADGAVGTGFMISREPISWCEAGTLCKSGPLRPDWQGKAWVTLNPNYFNLATIPDDAGTRSWGVVVAFGDPDFLNDVDTALADTPVRLF